MSPWSGPNATGPVVVTVKWAGSATPRGGPADTILLDVYDAENAIEELNKATDCVMEAQQWLEGDPGAQHAKAYKESLRNMSKAVNVLANDLRPVREELDRIRAERRLGSRKTLELFGEKTTEPGGTEVYTPFHTYSIRQAIEEGYILDVLGNDTTYETYRRISEADPADDKDVPVSKASKAIARFVSLHPTNLGEKAEIIIEHFRQKTAWKIGGHAKAMVVTRSRLQAVKYEQEIDKYIAKKGYGKGDDACTASSRSPAPSSTPTRTRRTPRRS